MNKKEKELLDEAILHAELLFALRWTEKISPDVPVPTGNWVSTGYLYSPVAKKVYEAWSHSDKHGEMPYMPKYGRKGGIEIYSTRALALQAMRYEIELRFASELLDLDKEIQCELNGSKKGK